MEYGNISFEINHKPVEVSILVEGQHQSGRFIANHDQRSEAKAFTALNHFCDAVDAD